MRIVSLTQGTKEWRDWRGKGLGASDAPVVMGVSPWQTAFELWTVKTGLCQPSEPHPAAVAAMRRGNDLEPAARELAEQVTGIAFPAIAGEHDEYAFIRASLDGYHEAFEVVDGKTLNASTILEIKCPGKADHADAVKGRVPKKYGVQMQAQFLVTAAAKGIYFSWDGMDLRPLGGKLIASNPKPGVMHYTWEGKSSPSIVAIDVLPDAEQLPKIKEALCQFWLKVETQTPPQASKSELGKLATRLAADAKRLLNTATAMGLLSEAL